MAVRGGPRAEGEGRARRGTRRRPGRPRRRRRPPRRRADAERRVVVDADPVGRAARRARGRRRSPARARPVGTHLGVAAARRARRATARSGRRRRRPPRRGSAPGSACTGVEVQHDADLRRRRAPRAPRSAASAWLSSRWWAAPEGGVRLAAARARRRPRRSRGRRCTTARCASTRRRPGRPGARRRGRRTRRSACAVSRAGQPPASSSGCGRSQWYSVGSGRMPRREQRVDEPLVVVQARGVDRPAARRLDARPGDREAVGRDAEGDQQREVLVAAAVAVAGDAAVGAVR